MYIYHLKSLKKNPLLTSKKVTEGCLIKDVRFLLKLSTV